MPWCRLNCRTSINGEGSVEEGIDVQSRIPIMSPVELERVLKEVLAYRYSQPGISHITIQVLGWTRYDDPPPATGTHH